MASIKASKVKVSKVKSSKKHRPCKRALKKNEGVLQISSLIFLIGFIILIIFSILPVFGVNKEIMLLGIKISFIIMAVSGIIIIICLCFERYAESKKFAKEIKKEDLIP